MARIEGGGVTFLIYISLVIALYWITNKLFMSDTFGDFFNDLRDGKDQQSERD